MSDRQPVAAVNITAQYEDYQLQPRDQAAVIPWEEAQERLATSGSYWFATTRPGGRTTAVTFLSRTHVMFGCVSLDW